MSRRLFAGLLAVLVVFAAPGVARADAAGTVKALHTALTADAQSAATLSKDQRRPRLTTVVRTAYAVRAMAETRVGAAWSRLSQRDQLLRKDDHNEQMENRSSF